MRSGIAQNWRVQQCVQGSRIVRNQRDESAERTNEPALDRAPCGQLVAGAIARSLQEARSIRAVQSPDTKAASFVKGTARSWPDGRLHFLGLVLHRARTRSVISRGVGGFSGNPSECSISWMTTTSPSDS